MSKLSQAGIAITTSIVGAATCGATTLDYFDLQKSVKYADVVAVVEVKSVRTIYFDADKSTICGYAITATVGMPLKPSTQHGDFNGFALHHH